MALDYTGSTTGLFVHLGALVKAVNEMGTDAASEDTYASAVQANWAAGSQESIIDLLDSPESAFSQAKSAIVSARASLASCASLLLTDHITVVTQLGIPSDSISDVLYALITQMIADSQTVKASSVSVGAQTSVGTPVGNNILLTTTALDGVQQPGNSMPAHPKYAGVASQLAIAETMRLTCIGDSYSGGASEGSETWQWSGALATSSAWSVDGEGSGQGVSVVTANASTIIANGDFERFATANIPDSWAVVAGTPGTHILQDVSTFYRGASAVKFVGDGSQATIEIAQAPSSGQLTPNQMYSLSFRYKASATDLNGVHFNALFTGTGYTAAGSEKVVITGDAWATNWTLASFFIIAPRALPSDFTFVLSVTGTPANGRTVWVDSLAFAPVSYNNGFGMVVAAGDTPPVAGDTYGVSVANTEGVFATFFRREFGIQLPASNSPTIADSLAQ